VVVRVGETVTDSRSVTGSVAIFRATWVAFGSARVDRRRQTRSSFGSGCSRLHWTRSITSAARRRGARGRSDPGRERLDHGRGAVGGERRGRTHRAHARWTDAHQQCRCTHVVVGVARRDDHVRTRGNRRAQLGAQFQLYPCTRVVSSSRFSLHSRILESSSCQILHLPACHSASSICVCTYVDSSNTNTLLSLSNSMGTPQVHIRYIDYRLYLVSIIHCSR
jgi:hypothetical protein